MIQVQENDFDIAEIHQQLRQQHPGKTGAICTFTGLVREFGDQSGVESIVLQHYPGMPEKQLAKSEHQLTQLHARLTQAMQQQLSSSRNQLSLQASRLDSVSPLSVLARGYSITKNQQGGVVKSVNDVSSGELITTELADGQLQSKVV